MKRSTYLIIAVIIFFAARYSFAQPMQEPKMGDKAMMMGQGMQNEGMMQMHGMMDKASMVSSNDGGVIILIGNTLYKYDKNLNLVKQMALPMDMPQMNKMEKKDMGMMEKKGCSCGMVGTCGGNKSQPSQTK